MTQVTKTIQQILPDPEKQAYYLGLLDQAKALTSQPPTGGLPDVKAAGLSDTQQQAIDLAKSGVGSYLPFLQTGQQTLGTAGQQLGVAGDTVASGIDPQKEALKIMGQTGDVFGKGLETIGAALPQFQAGAQTTASAIPGFQAGQSLVGQAAGTYGMGMGAPSQAMLDAYMNPYQQAVQDEINRSFDIQSGQADLQAARAGAFGGSRAAVQQSEIDRNRASALAQSQAQNFLQAQRGAQNELQRALAAAQGLGQLGATQGALASGVGQLGGLQARIGQGIGALGGQIGQLGSQIGQSALGTSQIGTTLGALGGQQAKIGSQLAGLGGQQAGLGQLLAGLQGSQIGQLAGLGGTEQKTTQAGLEADYQTQMANIYEPYKRIGFYSDILQGVPSSQQTVTQQSVPSPGVLNQLLGAGIAGAGVYGALR